MGVIWKKSRGLDVKGNTDFEIYSKLGLEQNICGVQGVICEVLRISMDFEVIFVW
jgi:hypothetical protein